MLGDSTNLQPIQHIVQKVHTCINQLHIIIIVILWSVDKSIL